jgi:hypothetical protein
MKKIGLITMFLLVMLMVGPVFAADINIYLGQGLNPAATADTRSTTSMFVDPSAKGVGEANKPNAVNLGQGLNPAAVTDTRPSTSMFVDPSAKGIGDANKPNGVCLGQGLNPAAVTATRINIFTGAPY